MDGPLSGMINLGMGLASGNPIAMGAGALGLGMSIFGAVQGTEAAKAKSEAEMKIAGFEQQADNIRRRAMEVSAQRQQIEVLRNAQRARSVALNNATTQGAQFGSGLQGGYGQITGAANWNISGINQSLGFGEQMFNTNALINQQKMSIASSDSSAATAAGIGSIGKTLLGNYTPIKNLSDTALKGASGPNMSDIGYSPAVGPLGPLY